MDNEYSSEEEQNFNARTLRIEYRRVETTIITTHSDDRSLWIRNKEESNRVDDLIEELEFKKEELQEYYSEGWELDKTIGEKVIVNTLLEANEAVFAENNVEEGQTLELGRIVRTSGIRAELSTTQLLDTAQQELLQRKIQRELDMDMRTRQKINLELHEVVNSLKGIEPKERNEEVNINMVNITNEPLSPIPEELMPPNSDEE
ncbi:17800_t:CDS:2 [Gigaspora rosea]|nr:17800_t:CDS:2 [Gigaspora rosea]